MRVKLSEKEFPSGAAMGAWPANAPDDLNVARAAIAEWLVPFKQYPKFILAGSKKMLNLLDAQFPKTDITYKTFFLNNNLVEDVVKLPIEEDSVIVFGFIVDFTDFPKIELEVAAYRITYIMGRSE